jgi:hypothetical protein
MIKTQHAIRKVGYSKKSKCDDCGSKYRMRNIVYFKGKYLCRFCRNKLDSFKLQSSANQIGRPMIKLEDFLSQTHEGTVYKDRSLVCFNLPICMAGKKFKIVLEEQ